MQDLPRDIQLDIIKRFDMDTRIKCGIVSKLKMPLALVSRLNMVYTFKVRLASLQRAAFVHIASPVLQLYKWDWAAFA